MSTSLESVGKQTVGHHPKVSDLVDLRRKLRTGIFNTTVQGDVSAASHFGLQPRHNKERKAGGESKQPIWFN